MLFPPFHAKLTIRGLSIFERVNRRHLVECVQVDPTLRQILFCCGGGVAVITIVSRRAGTSFRTSISIYPESITVAKAWKGRFSQPTDPRVEAFTESISFDARLAAVDIRGSQAHAQMLAHVGLISDDERDTIVSELDRIGNEIQQGEFPFRQELEDIHMHIESALIERIGDTGRKLHTGRSRNDQVSTDLKLWVRDAIDDLDDLLRDVQIDKDVRGREKPSDHVPVWVELEF